MFFKKVFLIFPTIIMFSACPEHYSYNNVANDLSDEEIINSKYAYIVGYTKRGLYNFHHKDVHSSYVNKKSHENYVKGKIFIDNRLSEEEKQKLDNIKNNVKDLRDESEENQNKLMDSPYHRFRY